MSETVFMIVKIILSIVSAFVAVYVIPLLKQWKENNQDDRILQMIEIAVRAAEQTFKGTGKGPAKKEEVLRYISEWLEQKGIHVSSDQLDQLIEAAVYSMNNEGILYTSSLD